MEKQKMSAFEHAILSIADPEKAQNYEPYTYWEEQKRRMDNLAEKEQQLFANMKTRNGVEPKIIIEGDFLTP